MTFTNKWRSTIPSRSIVGSLVDDHIRQLRLDFQERMESLLGTGGWTADPIQAVKYHYLHFSFANWPVYLAQWQVVNSLLQLQGAASTSDIYFPLMFAPGTKINDFYLACSTGAAGTIGWSIDYIDASGVPVTITNHASGTIPINTAFGNQLLTNTPLTLDTVVTNLKYYFVKVTLNNNGTTNDAKVLGLRLKCTNKPYVHL